MADEVLFEIHYLGNSARATAIDPRSGIEASIVGPASASEYDLKAMARRKLAYLLRRRQGEGGPPGAGGGRGGIVV